MESGGGIGGKGKGKGKGKSKGKGKGNGKGRNGGKGGGGGGGRNAARSYIVAALEDLAGCSMPRAQHTKLLNWRTSQASPPLLLEDEPTVTAEGGRLIFTGDWCVESSFEGCNQAAEAAATAVADAICTLR